MYHIRSLSPRTDIDIGAHGFQIDLHPSFKDYVARSEIGENNIQWLIKNSGDRWLDACGYYSLTEDGDGKVCRLYKAMSCLRISWGEWGPEHIDVPGSACGLDIKRNSFGCIFEDGVSLLPHNIDSWSQKQLLLIIFTEIAESILLLGRPVDLTVPSKLLDGENANFSSSFGPKQGP
jgi:hypothetical protein